MSVCWHVQIADSLLKATFSDDIGPWANQASTHTRGFLYPHPCLYTLLDYQGLQRLQQVWPGEHRCGDISGVAF